jgi:hypothetical protein
VDYYYLVVSTTKKKDMCTLSENRRKIALKWAEKTGIRDQFITGRECQMAWERAGKPLSPYIQAGQGETNQFHIPIETWDMFTEVEKNNIKVAFDAFAIWRNDVNLGFGNFSNRMGQTIGWEFQGLFSYQIESAFNRIVTGYDVVTQ